MAWKKKDILEKRTIVLSGRVTEAEWDGVYRAAQKLNMSISLLVQRMARQFIQEMK